MTQSFTIPGRFPGLNDFVKAVNSNRYTGNKMKQDYTHMVRLAALKLKRVENPVFITILWAEKDGRRDPDNVVFAKKFILDGLVRRGVLPNDNREWIIGFSETVMTDKNNPRVEVTLEERRLI